MLGGQGAGLQSLGLGKSSHFGPFDWPSQVMLDPIQRSFICVNWRNLRIAFFQFWDDL